MTDAGCILQSLIDYLAPHNHIMPIDLGAKGRCELLPTYFKHGQLNCPCLVATSVVMYPQMPVACDS